MVEQQEEQKDQLQSTYAQFSSQDQGTQKIMEQYSPFSSSQKNDNVIEISVSDPIQKDGGMTKYTSYNIKGNDVKQGPFDTYRRYNEFYQLREILVSRWPGCYVPPIPSKKAIGKNDVEIVEDRKRHLNQFCHKMAQNVHLYYSEEFQIFLRNKETDISKILEKLPKQKAADIVEKYKLNFPILNGKELDSDILLKISNLSGFLKKAQKNLHSYKETAKHLATVKRTYSISLAKLFNNLLPEYEEHCLSEYVSGNELDMIFKNEKGTPKISEFRKSLQEQQGVNPFQYIYDMLSFEYRDCEAFIEAVSAKDYYEKKRNDLQKKIRESQEELTNLHQGKKSLKSIFSKGNSTEQKGKLDQQIADDNIESANITTLIDLITGILGFIEIDKFKNGKKQVYHSVMKSVAALESLMTQQLTELWNEVGELSTDLLKD